jgi:hypothetical protein
MRSRVVCRHPVRRSDRSSRPGHAGGGAWCHSGRCAGCRARGRQSGGLTKQTHTRCVYRRRVQEQIGGSVLCPSPRVQRTEFVRADPPSHTEACTHTLDSRSLPRPCRTPPSPPPSPSPSPSLSPSPSSPVDLCCSACGANAAGAVLPMLSE